ncbi:transporter substrate-binding domain-containing protein [Mitsuaria sp. WAJ17]|uniref:substrate-binding periplasmic protein n=1 Tax=Mitsuaria sp. WAJ17 TaxID=2761452 RepID=UPI0016035D5B|nr:transporter substrate-binding domain-containing protein [Mitsuaria sp. WAJ17]MBB2483892.1 transporter substrate-binding domain-containing protein [Mitsuaria sp. WAJ17]
MPLMPRLATDSLPGRPVVLSLLCAGAVALPAAAAPAPWRLFLTEPFPPYTYERAGRPAGPMVDVLDKACEQLGWRCEVRVMPWRRALALAEQGEAHGLFAVADAPERRRYFALSSAVLQARYTLFGRQGESLQYKGPASLEGRTVAAYGPSGTSLTLAELARGQQFQSQIEPDNLTVLRMLHAGRYGPQGVVLMNEAVALWLTAQNEMPPLQAVGTVKQIGYHFGLSRQRLSVADQQRFQRSLQQLCRSGRMAELLQPYALPAAPCN